MSQSTPNSPASDFHLRAARDTDAATIATFNAAMALETEHLTLDPDRLLAGVRSLLDDPAKGFYLVAADPSDRVIGQLMITYEWSDWRNGVFWWIQSVFVATEWRGEGVFRALYAEAERLARESGTSCGLRLYVEAENTRAQQVYSRLGMIATSYQVYEVDFVLRR